MVITARRRDGSVRLDTRGAGSVHCDRAPDGSALVLVECEDLQICVQLDRDQAATFRRSLVGAGVPYRTRLPAVAPLSYA